MESTNHDLREQLSSMMILNHEQLEIRKIHLEEAAIFKHQRKNNITGYSHKDQYKGDIEEPPSQEIRQKWKEVNLFLQVNMIKVHSTFRVEIMLHLFSRLLSPRYVLTL